MSFNVNGLKALVSKDPGLLGRLAVEEGADLLLLQETKLQECFVLEYTSLVPGFVGFWSCSKTKKGYAGTATFVKACYVEGTALAGAASTSGGGSGNGGKQQQSSLKAFFGKKDTEAEQKEAAETLAAAAPAGPKLLSVAYGIDGDGRDEEGRCVLLLLGFRLRLRRWSLGLLILLIIHTSVHTYNPRVITVELPNLYVCNTYVPNSGMKLERLK